MDATVMEFRTGMAFGVCARCGNDIADILADRKKKRNELVRNKANARLRPNARNILITTAIDGVEFPVRFIHRKNPFKKRDYYICRAICDEIIS